MNSSIAYIYNLSPPSLHFYRLPSTCLGNVGDAADVRCALVCRTASLLFDGVDDGCGADNVGALKLPVET